jgi:hypothetical protein
MEYTDIQNILRNISYKPGWKIGWFGDAKGLYVQLSVDETSDATLDSVSRDGTRVPWKSGKRYLSTHMCRQEVVGAVFDLIKGAEMHEVHEWFRYKNASIYNPHIDPDVLVNIAKKKASFNVREDSMTVVD